MISRQSLLSLRNIDRKYYIYNNILYFAASFPYPPSVAILFSLATRNAREVSIPIHRTRLGLMKVRLGGNFSKSRRDVFFSAFLPHRPL